MSDIMIDNEPVDDEALVDTDTTPDGGVTAAPDPDAAAPGADGLGDDDTEGDTFPRKVVEKLRRESADHRGRAKAAEDQVTELQERVQAAETRVAAMQRQTVESRIKAAGMRPSAVWAVSKLDDVLAEDGSVDMAAVDRAMKTARSTLGIPQKRAGFPGEGELNSGATARREYRPGPSFVDSFRPRKND